MDIACALLLLSTPLLLAFPLRCGDNLSYFLTWVPLCAGIGLLICGSIRPPWAVLAVVTGVGAILAICWEVGEWYTFIRLGTELEGAYEDTLSDELLGLVGGFIAALFVAWRINRSRHGASAAKVEATPGCALEDTWPVATFKAGGSRTRRAG